MNEPDGDWIPRRLDEVGEFPWRREILPCERCRTNTSHEIVGGIRRRRDEAIPDIFSNSHVGQFVYEDLAVVECRGCYSLSFARRTMDMSTDWIVDPATNQQEFQWNVACYPRRESGRTLLNTDDLPSHVSAVYRETYYALSHGLPILTGIGIRAIVEAVCRDQGVDEWNLSEKIKRLQQDGKLTQGDVEVLQEVRKIGNDAAHEMRQEASAIQHAALDAAEHLLAAIYATPKRTQLLKGRKGPSQ